MKKEELTKVVGHQIKAARIAKGYTVEKLAELTNLSVFYMAQVCRGEKGLSFHKLVELSEILDQPLDYFVGKQRSGITPGSAADEIVSIVNTLSTQDAQHILDIITLTLQMKS